MSLNCTKLVGFSNEKYAAVFDKSVSLGIVRSSGTFVLMFVFALMSCFLCFCFITQKKTFTFTVRDSLVNICPLRDFAYGLRSNADQSATGLGKQSNYELVCGPNFYSCIMLFELPVKIVRLVK